MCYSGYCSRWYTFPLCSNLLIQKLTCVGWALTLLSSSNLSYASTAQTVGLTAGQFLSFTVFLAFNSKDFANRYFRSTPLDVGLITLSGYLTFWGWSYLVVTIGLAIIKKEERTMTREGLVSVYKTMWGIIKLKSKVRDCPILLFLYTNGLRCPNLHHHPPDL